VHSRHCKQRQFPPRTAEMAVAYAGRRGPMIINYSWSLPGNS
jgi:hypothetical protein